MLRPARTLWDTRIQCLCGLLTARSPHGVEVFLSATFAVLSADPPRVIVNLNRLYPIEPAIGQQGRFAINVMPASARDLVLRAARVRRREPNKAQVLGLEILEDHSGIPYLAQSQRTVFCEVERMIDGGDRRLVVARVLESRISATHGSEKLLFYSEVAGDQPRFPLLAGAARWFFVNSGTKDLVHMALDRLRPAPPPNLADATQQAGGQSEKEIAQVQANGLVDDSRRLTPPRLVPRQRKPIGVCVVGTGWGSFHCELVRRANPEASLFVCGRSFERAARVARAVGAQDVIIGLEKAVADPRVHAVILALPHDLHRSATETALSAGKHVLVEKPIANTLEDADAMTDAAKRAGRILMVAEDMHFRPAIGEAVRCIQRGDVGEPLYLLALAGGVHRPQGWAAQKERLGGGVLMDIGVHYLHALRLLLGEPDRVLASRSMQSQTKMEGEDSVQLLLSHRAGWQANLTLTWSSARGQHPDLVVLGDRGTLHLWPGKSYLDFYPVAPGLMTRLVSYVRPYWLQAKLQHPSFQKWRRRLPQGTGYEMEVREFLAAVAENRAPALPPQEARRDLEIVKCCYQALDGGAWVSIPSYD